jgi:hypothetical protein
MEYALMVYYEHSHEAKSYTSDIEKDMYVPLAPHRYLNNTRD